MWRSSGRGCTVMPFAPASSANVAARSTLGMPSSRVLRSSATLLTLTESAVVPRWASEPVARSGFMPSNLQALQVDHDLARAQHARPELLLDQRAQRQLQRSQAGAAGVLQRRQAAVFERGLQARQYRAAELGVGRGRDAGVGQQRVARIGMHRLLGLRE